MTREPFFERESTKQAIRNVATEESLRLFLGAGVAAESGLPPWSTLIERVLHRVAERLHVDLHDRPAFVAALVEHHGYLTSAAIAQSVLGRDATIEAVRGALYERVGYQPEPGFHAYAVADLVIEQLATSGNDSVPVITINYDRLIEDALEERLASWNRGTPHAQLPHKPLTVVGAGDIPADAIPVYHIHGCVAPRWDASVQERFLGSGDNTIVLGEQDYARLQHGGSNWQDETVYELLSSGGASLFTGMSLADPNIIRYLTSASSVGAGHRYALLSTQSERRWVSSLPAQVVERYDDALRRRLISLRIKAIKADYYVQVSQFLSEVLLYRAHADDWDESLWYGSRLDRWRDDMESVVLKKVDSDFFACQQALNRELNRVMREEILPLMESDGVEVPREERLCLELWLRNNHTPYRSLELWGSSVSTWSSYWDLSRPGIEQETTYSSVEAFMRGGYHFRRNGRPGSRWQYQLCQLIRLAEEPWFNLPVGVVVLSSTLPEKRASLANLTDAGKRSLQKLVAETGQQLCDPVTVAVALDG